MSEEYKETIDYRWTLARAVDRVAAARSHVHGRITKGELQLRIAEYRAALRALYAILPPSVRGSLTEPPREDVAAMDEWLAITIARLDEAKLLLRKKRSQGVREEMDDVD